MYVCHFQSEIKTPQLISYYFFCNAPHLTLFGVDWRKSHLSSIYKNLTIKYLLSKLMPISPKILDFVGCWWVKLQVATNKKFIHYTLKIWFFHPLFDIIYLLKKDHPPATYTITFWGICHRSIISCCIYSIFKKCFY